MGYDISDLNSPLNEFCFYHIEMEAFARFKAGMGIHWGELDAFVLTAYGASIATVLMQLCGGNLESSGAYHYKLYKIRVVPLTRYPFNPRFDESLSSIEVYEAHKEDWKQRFKQLGASLGIDL